MTEETNEPDALTPSEEMPDLSHASESPVMDDEDFCIDDIPVEAQPASEPEPSGEEGSAQDPVPEESSNKEASPAPQANPPGVVSQPAPKRLVSDYRTRVGHV
jgi:hypothetical protein